MEIFHSVFEWYMANLNYFTIALLMTIEASFIPFPSEVVVPFAAYKAAQGELNFFLVLFFSTLGAICGSLINYYLAYYLGRPLVYKFADSRLGRVLLLSKEKVVHSEEFFLRNGKSSTFIGRLVPAVRQLISIPAGLAKMSIRDFLFYTFLGAGLWNLILAVIGYYFYEVRESIYPYLGEIFLGVGVIFVIYLVYKWRKGRTKPGVDSSKDSDSGKE
ncbi:MAG: DedA family protein [Bacteroidales bacterium]|nr:DedA family protein [Bacteroidales bacterium]